MDVALEWLKTVFDPQTKEKALHHSRVLLMDGHNSHFSLAFLEYSVTNNIAVICYPAHCTHALQGLDVVCFAKMKHIWHTELDEYYKRTGTHVAKNTYAQVFGTAFNKAFDKETILAAFRATGVHPFDPNAITEQQMKPSQVTSTRSTFPLPMPSPVRRAMSAYHQLTPKQNATSLTNLPIESTPSIATNTCNAQGIMSSPHTPTQTRSRTSEFNVDPSLFTPSKQARAFKDALESSESGSHLLSRPRLDSLAKPITPIVERLPYMPEPDWSLTSSQRDPVGSTSMSVLQLENKLLRTNLQLACAHVKAHQAINEAANAQLIIQNIQAEQLNSALHERGIQLKRKKDERFGADGKGVVYTSADVIEIKRKMEAEAHLKTTEKDARAKSRACVREAKEKIKEEWKEMQRVHTERLTEWKAQVAELKVQKVPRNQWPSAPPRPKKPTLPSNIVELTRRRAKVVEEQDQRGSVSASDDNDDDFDGILT